MAMENCEDGTAVEGNLLQAIRFADDQAVLADTKRGLGQIDSCREI